MASKKTVKKKSSNTSKTSAHHFDDHSFLIITGGGLIILMILGIIMMNKISMNNIVAKKMQIAKEQTNNKTVEIKNFAFSPNSLTVKVNTPVYFVNNDTVDHAVVADDGTFDTKLLASGEKGSYTFTKIGTYTYTCSVHPSMTGTIVVTE